MAGPDDEASGADTLPRPELNPLLNPRLAQNMGRWAEVYFTASPERREEAVLELLRELEHGNPHADVTTVSQNRTESRAGETLQNPGTTSGLPTEGPIGKDQTGWQCRSCGHENPTSHQFCGMCGEKLASERAAAQTPSDLSSIGRSAGTMDEAPSTAAARNGALSDRNDAPPNPHDEGERTDELARLRRISENNFRQYSAYSEASPSRPYRIYIGVALAFLLCVLAYLGWHGSQSSNAKTVSPPATSAVKDPNAPQAATSTVARVNNPTGPTAGTPPVLASVADPARNETVTHRGTAGVGAAPTASADNPLVSSGGGAEELAIARRYLNGGDGVARNSAEAAEWLWKSIAKHNSEATLLLADLYLKGDGVAKNCDQARVLLDSAASKGVAGAGERLRNLQAFSCQ